MRLFPVLLILLVLATTSNTWCAASRCVCGLNLRSGRPLQDWVLPNGSRTAHIKGRLADYQMIANLQRLTRTDYMPDEMTHLGLPAAIWLVRGVANAYAGPVYEGSDGRAIGIFLDEDWLNTMEQTTGNHWLRKAVLAHELGHVVHGDVWDHGQRSTWQVEYQADEFTGYAMCLLGAPQSGVDQLFRLIAFESVSEDMNSHPSLAYRLRAIAEGYARARGR